MESDANIKGPAHVRPFCSVWRSVTFFFSRLAAPISLSSKIMDFSELSDALGGLPQWTFLSAVISSISEVVTGSFGVDPKLITDLVLPSATARGLDLVSPSVLRACLRKILADNFAPLARVLRDAFEKEPLEFEEGVDDLFDPIAQETVTHGFRINSGGSIVLSLPNLVHWVLVNGMRHPSQHGAIVSIDRVRCNGVPFPPVNEVFLQHIRNDAFDLLLETVAVDDSIGAAHASLAHILHNFQTQTLDERKDVIDSIFEFIVFWKVEETPHLLHTLVERLNDIPPEQNGIGLAIALDIPHLFIPPVMNLMELFDQAAMEEAIEQ